MNHLPRLPNNNFPNPNKENHLTLKINEHRKNKSPHIESNRDMFKLNNQDCNMRFKESQNPHFSLISLAKYSRCHPLTQSSKQPRTEASFKSHRQPKLAILVGIYVPCRNMHRNIYKYKETILVIYSHNCFYSSNNSILHDKPRSKKISQSIYA